MLKTSDFDFILPEELIATNTAINKEETKMLIFKDNKILDAWVKNIVDHLSEGDVMVFNNAKVIKAKLTAKNLANSAIININLDQEKDGIWQALCKPAKKVATSNILQIADEFAAEVLEKKENGMIKIRFNCHNQKFFQLLDKYGEVPLPPYILKARERNNIEVNQSSDEKNYQTIYAKNQLIESKDDKNSNSQNFIQKNYAVAAPTAGLHFNEKILSEIEAKGIKKAFITLNVGAGTFLPVKSEKIQDHKMHFESFSINDETVEIINQAKSNNKKIIAVGTTSLRAIESSVDENLRLTNDKNSTNIFIYPPYKCKIIDALMTNFHLPKSTLFMLICALVGVENGKEIYRYAIENKYRFYSFGDSSLLFF
jgi:S-adenosylmethionine:tRNA ribosyltransferase-isomerase